MSTKLRKPKPSQSSPKKRKSSLLNFLWGPAIAGFIIAYLLYHRDYFLSNNPTNLPPASEAESFKKSLIKKKIHFHEKMCSPSTKECFKIQDVAYEKFGELAVERNMMIGDTMYSFSAASLIVPTDLTEDDNKDMRNWKIDKRILISGYGKVMVGFVFAMEGLKYKSTTSQNVLMIGLGGGAVTNFLSTLRDAKLNLTSIELDPTVRAVAMKWFDLVENDQHTVIIGDGAKFIKDEAKKGTKYNAILLDACYTVCPAKVFLKPDVVADAARILDDNGVMAINVLTEMNKRQEQSDHILNLYKTQFQSCFLFYIRAQQVLLCSHRKGWTLEEHEDNFQKKLEEVDDNFDFHFTR